MMDWPTDCHRCGADLTKVSSIMSKFNQDTICSSCKARERAHPEYKAADEAEIAAVRAGQMNFPGVGAPRVLYLPACAAELAAIELDGLPISLAEQIVGKHNGDYLAASAHGMDHYRFPDGSELGVHRASPVKCIVLAYPSQTGA